MPLRFPAAACAVVLVAAPAALAQPTVEDTALGARLPEALRSVCAAVPPEARTPGAVAAVRCDPAATGGVDAVYERYTTHAAAQTRYLNLLIAGSPSGAQTELGACATDRPSEHAWTVGRVFTGRIACFTTPAGAAVTVWTHVPTGIVAVASRSDGDHAALGTWWTTAGPDGARIETRLLAIGGLFPDPYETGLLDDLAPAVAVTCRRARGSRSRTTIQAAVLCVGPGGTDSVLYRRFATKAATEASYRAVVTRSGFAFRRPGLCRNGVQVEDGWSYTGGAVTAGRLACGVARGFAQVIWFARDTRIQGIAVRKGRDLRPVIRWWRARG